MADAPSSRSPRRRYGTLATLLDTVLLGLLLAGGLWFALTSPDALHAVLPQQWEWGRVFRYVLWHDAQGWHAGLLLRGLWATLRLGCWAGLLALLLGVGMGMMTARRRGPGGAFFHALVTLLRNIPPLVLLFLIYFFASERLFQGLEQALRQAPPLLRDLVGAGFASPDQVDRMASAVLALGLYEGAYVAEIVRAGLQSVPSGQWDAGAAIGFSRWQRLRLVILPQSLPLMLPPLAGQCISTFKDSALAGLISVPELTFQGMEVMAVTRLPFETWAIAGLLYLVLSLCCSALFRRMEYGLRWYHPAT